MKRMKKPMAMMFALVMALALTVSAHAESITVENGAPGATYDGYQLMTLVTSLKCGKTEHTHGDTCEAECALEEHAHSTACYAYAYTVNPTYAGILAGIAGVALTDTEAPLVPTAAENNDIVAYVAQQESAAETRAFADAVWVAIEAAGLDADADATDDDGDGVTENDADDVDGEATFSNVSKGYWLIVDTTPGDTLEPSDWTKSLVMLDTSTFTISSKAEQVTVEKNVSADPAGVPAESIDCSIGDAIYFQITGTLDPYMSEYETYTYVFTDTMSAGLTFDVNNETGALEYLTITNGSTDVSSYFDYEIDGQVLTVTAKDALKDSGLTGSIVIEYRAVVTADAIMGNGSGNLSGNTNEVYLTYSRHPYSDDTGVTPPDEAIVFTFALDGWKYTVEDGKEVSLAGARFKLYRMNDTTKEYATLDADGKVSGWTAVAADAGVSKSAQTGDFGFTGLDAGVYWLEEIEAPDGYNLLDEDLKVEIIATYNSDQTAITALKVRIADEQDLSGEPVYSLGTAGSGTVEVHVENNTGVELPSTGGMGTTVFYTLGGLLVMGAGILLVTKKRMHNAQQ